MGIENQVDHSSFEVAMDEARALESGEETSFSIKDLEGLSTENNYQVTSELVGKVIEDDGDLDGIAQEILSLAEDLEVPALELFLKVLELAKEVQVSNDEAEDYLNTDAEEDSLETKDSEEKQEKVVNPENAPKDKAIFAVCSNGNGRSKFVARVLGNLGYDKPRAIGFHNLNKLDPDLEKELLASKVIVCTNTDVATHLSAHDGGRFVKDKIIIDLEMHENDHAIASGHMTEEMQEALKEKLTTQLQGFGF